MACIEKPGYQPKQDGAAIKSLYQMGSIPDMIACPREDDDHFNTAVAMEEIDLEATPLPNMIWTPTKYKPKDVPHFILCCKTNILNLMINGRKIGGTILPGYKPVFEVKRKGNNAKLTEEHSQYLKEFVEKHPTCILEFTMIRTQARFANRNSDDMLE
ncbi:hypothetical protein EDC96DRAFT_554725 [Choanephora cucurbitarum]|nr:hypothetical protein EDC96DRAFT_554725 [Choanephora cucurbitarum]